MTIEIQGVYTAIVTPFTASGEVDREQLRQQIAFQVEGGVDGIVPVGTTGESPTLSEIEHHSVIADAVKFAAGKARVMAGTGSNNTGEAIGYTRAAKEAGADCCLVVNPYYNKPSQEGLYRHFMMIADTVDVPICLYNIPGRTGVNLLPKTVVRLAAHPNIVAIKEATGSLDATSEIVASTDLSVMSGDDVLTLPLMSVGGKGVVSVASNLMPETIKQMVDLAASGDFVAAREIHLRLFPLLKSLFVETNPVPVKAAMAMLSRDSGEVRLPLCELSGASEAILRQALTDAGLLK